MSIHRRASWALILALWAVAPAAAQQGFIGVPNDVTITTGGTAQTLFAGATPRNGWTVLNPDTSEDCWASDSTTALANGAGSTRLAANGGGYETPVLYRPPGSLSVVCATTGHKLTARMW